MSSGFDASSKRGYLARVNQLREPEGWLRADCDACVALCCVLPAFSHSADVAIDKGVGHRCPHLGGDHRCGIHASLRPQGFPACAAFDCYGAGQRLTERAALSAAWAEDPEHAASWAPAFWTLVGLHQLLWLLQEARQYGVGPQSEVHAAFEATRALAEQVPGCAVDLNAQRSVVAPLLREVSVAARASWSGPDHAGADLVGADLQGEDLRGASLRGALLVGANLRGANVRHADWTGADLRGAQLHGADLSEALFLAPSQLAAARGDGTTRLSMARPDHWGAGTAAPGGA